jgi:hypothetical protein
MDDELAALGAIVGAPAIAVARAGWGFENETLVVTLADRRRLVVQRLARRAGAAERLHLAQILPDRLAAAGLRAPRQLAANAAADPPYAVREYLPGQAGAICMSTPASAVELARAMGALLPRLAAVDTSDLPLRRAWADPASLAELAAGQLDACRSYLALVAIDSLGQTIAELPLLFAGREAVFAHGDFCPVNVLIQASGSGREATGVSPASRLEPPAAGVVGLVDLEYPRLADPLFDAAWWGWVVRYHHPELWAAAWPQLLAAAGIAAGAGTMRRVAALQRLRCLEMLAVHADAPSQAAMWAERLAATLEWS